jgi:hypothetical protein
MVENLFLIFGTYLMKKIVHKNLRKLHKNSLKAVLFTKINQFFRILIKIAWYKIFF